MDAGTVVKGATEHGFRLLDKVTEFRFALALLSVAIALDVALAWGINRNVLTMDWTTLGANSIAKLGLATVAYVFWMAALSPLVRVFVEYLIMLLGNTRLGIALSSVKPEHEVAERRYAGGRVRVNEAKLCALKDKDSFWMAQVEKAEGKAHEERSEMAALASLSFSVAGLMLMDWLESEYSIAGEILVWLDRYSGRTGSVAMFVACVAVIALPWFYRARAQYPNDVWIEHPELAKEHCDAIEARRRNACL